MSRLQQTWVRINAPTVMVVLLLLHRMLSVFLRWHYQLGMSSLSMVCQKDLNLFQRPELTWRDIQHLCVNFAKLINADDPDWEPTAVGRPYSYKYGYGRLDAHAYVKAAQEWTLVKPQAWIDMPIVQLQDGSMTNEGEMSGGEPIIEEGVRSSLTLSEHKITEHNFEKLEHITVTVWISHSLRGDVEVELQSPNGVKSILAARRKFDNSGHGFRGWRFMTVKHWYVYESCLFIKCTISLWLAGTRILLATGQFASLTRITRMRVEDSLDGL